MRLKTWITGAMGVSLLCACTPYQDSGRTEEGLVYHFSRSDAFVSEYVWDMDITDTSITIPDEVEGKPVTALGGFFGTGVPSPFMIFIDSADYVPAYDVPDPDDYGVPVTWRDLVFTVHVGRNVKEVRYTASSGWCGLYDSFGRLTFYDPVMYFECDPDNAYFFSEDGVLFSRETGEADEKALPLTKRGEPGPEFTELSLAHKTAGRWVMEENGEMTVTEIFPAFGRLWANTGNYTEGSLYAFSAADMDTDADLNDPSVNEAVFRMRRFSDFSNAGEYWTDEAETYLLAVTEDSLTFTPAGPYAETAEWRPFTMKRDDTEVSQFPASLNRSGVYRIPNERLPFVLKTMESNDCFVEILLDGTIHILMKKDGTTELYRGKCGFRMGSFIDFSVTKLGGAEKPYSGTVTYEETEEGVVLHVSEGADAFPLIPEGEDSALFVQ